MNDEPIVFGSPRAQAIVAANRQLARMAEMAPSRIESVEIELGNLKDELERTTDPGERDYLTAEIKRCVRVIKKWKAYLKDDKATDLPE
mgnify:CR=1 FL=1